MTPMLRGVTTPITDRDILEAKAARPLRSDKPQLPADDGLFDVAGRGQLDLVDAAAAAGERGSRGVSDYYARQEARRERLERRAERLNAKAAAEFDKADLREEKSGIPLGQPILVGHHSERRHRNILKRADNAMRRGVEASKAAGKAAASAANIGYGGISSDAPDAIELLEAKAAGLEAKQEYMKGVNKAVRAAWKRGVRSDGTDEEISLMVKAVEKATGKKIGVAAARLYLEGDFCGRRGYPSYALQNNNANIKRVRDRISQIKAIDAAPEREAIEGEGWKVWEDRDENRVFIAHDAKPSAAVRKNLKSRGFRWNRYAGAWSRKLNNAAWYAAECLAKNGELDG